LAGADVGVAAGAGGMAAVDGTVVAGADGTAAGTVEFLVARASPPVRFYLPETIGAF